MANGRRTRDRTDNPQNASGSDRPPWLDDPPGGAVGIRNWIRDEPGMENPDDLGTVVPGAHQSNPPDDSGFVPDTLDHDSGYGAFGHRDERRRRRPQGPHRGRGPKGYRRPDERIREDLCERLTDDALIDASDIEVHVQACEVALTGSVASREARRRAEDIAVAVSGVIHVRNDLRIHAPSAMQSDMMRTK
jgi:hypothetical protein